MCANTRVCVFAKSDSTKLQLIFFLYLSLSLCVCPKELSQSLGDDKNITEHLKLPIQRINDYQLLLKVTFFFCEFILLFAPARMAETARGIINCR